MWRQAPSNFVALRLNGGLEECHGRYKTRGVEPVGGRIGGGELGVQRGGNRMGVNVQLIDAETGNHLWAERFDKPLADLFDMQDETIARRH